LELAVSGAEAHRFDCTLKRAFGVNLYS